MASTQIQSTPANETFRVYSRYNDYPNTFPGDQADDPVPPEVTQVLLFNRGFGSDTIETNVPIRRAPGAKTLVKSQPYVIQLGEGITSADVELVWNSPKLRDPDRNNYRDDRGYNLTWSLSIKGTTDVITVRDFLPLLSPWPTTPRGLVGIEFADGSRWTPDQVQLQLMGEVSGASTEGADSIVGSLGNDVIMGLAGDDTLLGNYGDDTLQGGAGNDSLNGAYGFDTYVFNRGDGHDTIALDLTFPTYQDYLDNEYRDNGDVLRLGAGIGFEDFVLSALDNKTGYRLDFTSGGQPTGDSVDLLVRTDGGGSEHVIRFADGNGLLTTLFKDILNGSFQPIGSVRGTSGDDTLQAFRTNSRILAGEGNDRIISGPGDDDVYGGPGADVLVFGSGSGADRYMSAQSDQQDTIELTGSLGLNDFVVYNDPYTTDANLSLVLKDGSAALLLTDATGRGTGPLPSISDLPSVKLGDGTLLSPQDLYALRQQSTDGADTLYANPFQTLSGRSGDDVLIAGALGGRLNGWDGNDTLVAGTGNADLWGGEGADTFVLGPLSTTRAIRQTIDADDADTIEFAAGIQRSDVLGAYTLADRRASLTINIAGNERSSVEVLNMRQATGLRLKFADGSIGKGVDLLPAQGLRLTGSNSDDTLTGFLGNDTLAGGGGNDLLEGDAGADTYLWSFTGGDDTIVADDDDTIEFTNPDIVGLTIGKLGATTPNAVVLRTKPFESSGSITLTNAGQWAGLRVKLPDGSVITGAQIMAEATRPYDLSLQGTVNADALQGGAGNDTLSGLAGNDTLMGAEGLDVLIGGTGSDVLDGGAGADTYQYAVGDGADLIRADGLDTIALGAGLSKANVQIGKLGAKLSNAVVLGMGSNVADTITLDNAGNWASLQLKFADGSTLSGADILASATKPDNLTLTGTTKADVLTGKDGNDTLSGLAGNDTLAGGKGNDSLIGGKGNDTYLFNRGDGQDVIVDNDSTWFNSDLLRLGDATSKQLWLTKAGNNLDIQILGTSDKVTVQNWFASSSNRVEKITASDGKSLSASKVQALVNAMASFTPPADAASLPANAPAALTKLVASSWV